jgi:hypothetical protein
MIRDLMMEDLEFEPIAISAFINEQTECLVMSMTFLFASEKEAELFSQSLNDVPEELSTALPIMQQAGMDFEIELIDDIGTIGDVSTALRMRLEAEEEALTYEFILFQQESVGASLILTQMGESTQTLLLISLARTLDSRILEALSMGE